MDKKEVIERFCSLSTEVGEFFDSKFAYDCFCEEANDRFQFEKIIIKFIEMCVREAFFRIENTPDEIDLQITKLQLIKELKAKS